MRGFSVNRTDSKKQRGEKINKSVVNEHAGRSKTADSKQKGSDRRLFTESGDHVQGRW